MDKSAAKEWVQKVIIRHMHQDDLPELEWDGEFSHFRRVYADAYRRYVRGGLVMWVAELPEKGIIGQVFIQLNSNRKELADGKRKAYLYSFRIKPEYRSAGLGTRILEVVEDDLKNKGYNSVTLNVAKDNIGAQRLYERQGYKITAHEPGVWSYPDEKGQWQLVNEPAWRMEKKL